MSGAPRLFTRPAPVLAMLLVALNDHALKGAGLLPGWLTGKLSDVMGLYFAPLLLAELWDARAALQRGGATPCAAQASPDSSTTSPA